MNYQSTNVEYLLTRKTAEEYRSKGYEVVLEPELDFFPGFRPDMVVRKDGQSKVVEVRTRSLLGADPRVSDMSRIIESKPGWSFELLLVAEPEKMDSPEGARSFVGECILDKMGESAKFLEEGHPEAAFLLAWSALEAALREQLAEEGVPPAKVTTSSFVIEQAVNYGVISLSDCDTLTQIRKYRNAIAHGFEVDGFSPGLVRVLLDTTRGIIEQEDRLKVS